jgi:hypothetical protein
LAGRFGKEESAEHASQLIRKAVMAQVLSLSQQPLVPDFRSKSAVTLEIKGLQR